MKNVEQIRQRIVRGQAMELQRLKIFVSMIDGNNDALAQFEGRAGEQLLAGVTDFILAHLGHVTVVPPDEAQSRSRRVVAKTLR